MTDPLSELLDVVTSLPDEVVDLAPFAETRSLAPAELSEAIARETGVVPLSSDGLLFDRFALYRALTLRSTRRSTPSVRAGAEVRPVSRAVLLSDLCVTEVTCQQCGARTWIRKPGKCPSCAAVLLPRSHPSEITEWNDHEVQFQTRPVP